MLWFLASASQEPLRARAGCCSLQLLPAAEKGVLVHDSGLGDLCGLDATVGRERPRELGWAFTPRIRHWMWASGSLADRLF